MFKRIRRSKFEVQMEVMGAFAAINTATIPSRTVSSLMACTQTAVAEVVLLGNFPSVFHRRFAPLLARGDLVRSVTENTLEIGLCCCVVESCFDGFLRLDTLLLLFLCSRFNFFNFHAISNLFLQPFRKRGKSIFSWLSVQPLLKRHEKRLWYFLLHCYVKRRYSG